MQEIHHQVKIIHLCNIGYRAIIGKELDDKEHQHEIAHIIDFIIFPFLPQQIQEYGIIGDKGENASTRSQLHIIVVKVCVLTKLLIGKEIGTTHTHTKPRGLGKLGPSKITEFNSRLC